MTSNRPNVALITSTIAPSSNVRDLKRRGAAERLADYLSAFEFYCECLRRGVFQALVYVDNSGHPLDPLITLAERREVRPQVEFISFQSAVSPLSHRFYLELDLIARALELSAFLRGRDVTIWKITGRYIIRNVQAIVARCSRENRDLYINCRNRPLPWADFYIAGFTRRSFEVLFAQRLDDYRATTNGETTLRQYLDLGGHDLAVMKRFPVVPRVEGIRGFDGARYEGLRHASKYYLRVILNFALPHLWI